jgi:mannose-6-phosphate isomerase-like protein (cupin superfamily)
MLDLMPASHEDTKDPGVFKKVLLKQHELMNGRVQMINWAMLPVHKAFEQHYHEDMQEIFIMIRGKATIWVDDKQETLGPGDAVVIPMKSIHKMRNVGVEQVEYIVIGISQGKKGKTVVVHET